MYNCKVELTLKRFLDNGYLDLEFLKNKIKDSDYPNGELLYREVLLTTNTNSLKKKLTEVDSFINLGLKYEFPNEVEVEDLHGTVCSNDLFDDYVFYLYGNYKISFNFILKSFIYKFIVQTNLYKSYKCGLLDRSFSRPKLLNLLNEPNEIFDFINLLSEEEVRYILLEIDKNPIITKTHKNL